MRTLDRAADSKSTRALALTVRDPDAPPSKDMELARVQRFRVSREFLWAVQREAGLQRGLRALWCRLVGRVLRWRRGDVPPS